MNKIKCYSALIIDDEPAARRVLRSMLARHGALVQIKGEASNGIEAVGLIEKEQPDLVFLDIQMPGLTGFEVLQEISHQPNIIFTTAYEEYALKAFDNFSIDYLLKPIRQERLDAALEKLKNFGKTQTAGHEELKALLGTVQQKKPTAFPVKLGDRILLFRYENISHFEADDKYVGLFTIEGKKYLTDHTLASLEQKLPDNFLRVQKSFIINRDRIREIFKHFNGRFLIVMNDPAQTRILSGLTFYESIKAELGL
jgi:two-component system, LytTR family, response regulator